MPKDISPLFSCTYVVDGGGSAAYCANIHRNFSIDITLGIAIPMNADEFRILFVEKLNEAARIAEASLGSPISRNFIILRDSPKSDGRRISVDQAASELFVTNEKFFRIIDLAVVEVSPTTTTVWARESGHAPGSFDNTWNQPPGSGPFKQLISADIRQVKAPQ